MDLHGFLVLKLLLFEAVLFTMFLLVGCVSIYNQRLLWCIFSFWFLSQINDFTSNFSGWVGGG